MSTATLKRPKNSPPAKQPAQTENPLLDAIAFTALAKCPPAKSDAYRDMLAPGSHQVDLAVRGTIDGETWKRDINGMLVIGADSAPQASSSTPWQDLLNSALCLIPAKKRQEWLAVVAKGEIPTPTCSETKAAGVAAEIEPALKAYRQTKQSSKRGSVSFVAG